MSGFTRSNPIIPVNKLTGVHQALRKLMRLHGSHLVLVHATHASIPRAETPLPSIPRDSPVSAGSSEKMFTRPRKCVYVHKNGCSTISESLEAKFHLVWLLRHHNHKTPWSCPLRVLREVSVFHIRSTNMDWCLTSYSHVPV